MDNQVALITGGNSGIGRALAIGFAKAGIDLILVNRIAAHAEQTKKDCEALGRKVIVAEADVANYDQVKKAVDAGLTVFGKIDILVNNAGYSRMKRIERMRVEEFQTILNTNVLGVYSCTHAVVPSMLQKGGGVILTTGSLVMKAPTPKMTAYAMSKSAIIGFTESLAEELKNNKITVNAICPSFVNTPMFREGLTEEQIKMMNPMAPEALVPYFLFFTTEEAKKVTGLMVDVEVVKKVVSFASQLHADAQVAPSWSGLEPITKEKLGPEEFKDARKCRKLIEYLLTTQKS